jgi:hypothetical protein
VPVPEVEAKQKNINDYGVKKCERQKWHRYFFIFFHDTDPPVNKPFHFLPNNTAQLHFNPNR